MKVGEHGLFVGSNSLLISLPIGHSSSESRLSLCNRSNAHREHTASMLLLAELHRPPSPRRTQHLPPRSLPALTQSRLFVLLTVKLSGESFTSSYRGRVSHQAPLARRGRRRGIYGRNGAVVRALHHGSRRGWFVDKKHHSCTWIRHEFISLFYQDVAATLERLVQSS